MRKRYIVFHYAFAHDQHFVMDRVYRGASDLYSLEDAMALAQWLNEREDGYPESMKGGER